MTPGPDHQAEVDSRRLKPVAASFAETATAKRIGVFAIKDFISFFLIKVVMQEEEGVLQRIIRIIGFHP